MTQKVRNKPDPAVLGNPGTRGGGEDARAGGDVYGARVVAADS